MNWRAAVPLLVGLVVLALGTLWVLQGADAVRVRPILCATNCRPVTGGSSGWLAAGTVASVIGVGVIVAATRRIHHPAR